MKKLLPIIAAAVGLSTIVGIVASLAPESINQSFPVQNIQGKATVFDRLTQYGQQTEARWQPFFAAAGIAYPPSKIVLVGLKREKKLEVYAANNGQTMRLVRSLPILAASGKIGPKLRYGDYQVPEGIYHIESLNPNSAFHLSLRVSYPNEQDRAQAEIEGRTNLGGDIMIHGSNVSVGCLAMGDEAAEDLFILAAQTGIEKMQVLLCPLDFRTNRIPSDPNRPHWVRARYTQLKTALKQLPST